MKQIKRFAPENLPVVLIGNKCDLVRRQVLEKEGRTVAEQNGIEFVECSAKEDIGVEDAVMRLVKGVKLEFLKEEKVVELEKEARREAEGVGKKCSC